LVGGLIFWLYFFEIRNFPDLSFDESVLLLLLATLTGIFFLLLMAAMLMTPYLLRWMMLKAYDSDFDGKDRQKWGRVELIWYFSSIYLAIIAFFLYKFDFGESDIILPWIFENSECVYWVLIVAIFVGHVCCYLFGFFGKIWNSKIELPDKAVLIIQVLFFWILTLFSLIMPLNILILIEEQTEAFGDTNPIKLLAVFFFLVMFTNGIYAYFQEQLEKRKWWFYLIPFLALLFTFFLVNDLIIPKMVMRRFHFGSFTAEQLILDKEGCKLLRSMELEYEPVKDENNIDLKECYLKKICILSRLGHVFALEKKVEGKKFNFYIPKDHVLSWRIIKKEKADTESGKENDSDSFQAETCPIK
jgi:hypothetical protein